MSGKERIEQKLERELGTSLIGLLREPNVVEVMVNADGSVWVERLGAAMECASFRVDAVQTKAALGTLAALLDTVVTADAPILQGEVPRFHARIQGLRPPVVQAPVLVFRKKASKVFDLASYVETGRMTARHYTLLKAAISGKKNVIVAGGTGSGKTTFINALLKEIAKSEPHTRLLLIEDTRELQCEVKNRVEARAVPGVACMNELLRSALRMRPDRIIIGEVRGPEALTLLKAWNTGHPGGLASLHANGPAAALRRLELLNQEATGHPLRELIAEVVDMVVFLERGARVQKCVEVTGLGPDGYRLKEVEKEHESKASHRRTVRSGGLFESRVC